MCISDPPSNCPPPLPAHASYPMPLTHASYSCPRLYLPLAASTLASPRYPPPRYSPPARTRLCLGTPTDLLWPRLGRYIEEFSVSNFLGISASGAYVTPSSGSILPSITNQMLMQLARDAGLEVEHRPVEYSELPSFKEVGACGTATVVAPIASITDAKGKHEFPTFDILNKLRMQLQKVQYGEAEDKHGWMEEVSC